MRLSRLGRTIEELEATITRPKPLAARPGGAIIAKCSHDGRRGRDQRQARTAPVDQLRCPVIRSSTRTAEQRGSIYFLCRCAGAQPRPTVVYRVLTGVRMRECIGEVIGI